MIPFIEIYHSALEEVSLVLCWNICVSVKMSCLLAWLAGSLCCSNNSFLLNPIRSISSYPAYLPTIKL